MLISQNGLIIIEKKKVNNYVLDVEQVWNTENHLRQRGVRT